MVNERTEMIAQTTIIGIGWAKSMIDKLLPEPTLKPNPHYRRAAPMKLWEKSLVVKTMETDEFRKMLEKAQSRKAAANAAVETKKQNLIDNFISKANDADIIIIPDDELIAVVTQTKEEEIRARLQRQYYKLRELVWYGYRHDLEDELVMAEQELDDYSFSMPGEDTLNRWIVNYIRHNLINYDSTLQRTKGKTGKQESYPIYKCRILQRISEAYPKYADECARQAKELEDDYSE